MQEISKYWIVKIRFFSCLPSSGMYRSPERILADSPAEWRDIAGKNPPGGIFIGITPISLPLCVKKS